MSGYFPYGHPFISSIYNPNNFIANMNQFSFQPFQNPQFSNRHIDIAQVKMQMKEPNPVKIEEGKQKRQQIVKVRQEASRTQKPKPQKRRNKSVFHNYQKHLITTLRQKVQIEDFKGNCRISECSKTLWTSFMSSKFCKRSILLAVFGHHYGDDKINQSFQKCSMLQISLSFTTQEIRQSQKRLRSIVITRFKNIDLDKELSHRKISEADREVFKKYIGEFIWELEEGGISKRLPKQYKKLNFSKHVNTQTVQVKKQEQF